MNKSDEIKKLKSLLDDGAITEEEFNTLKKNLISQYSESINAESENKSIKQNVRQSSIKNNERNALTASLYNIGRGLGIILGIVFWIRYESFIAFLISIILSIVGLFWINKIVLQVTKRNLFLGALNLLFLLLIIIPIGNNSSMSASESTDDIAYMKCRYCGEELIEKNNQGIMSYTSEPDGIGILTFYSGSRYDVYCSEECAKKGIMVGYGYTEH